MPFNYGFYKRDIPFIVDLKSKEQSSQSCQKKCCSQSRVPDFSVKLKGVIANTIEKITD